MINGATINNAGKVYISTAGAIALYKGGLPYTADGALAITNLAPQYYKAGFAYNAGRLCGTNITGNPPAGSGFNAGFSVTADGRLHYTTVNPLTEKYNRGWPIAANTAVGASTTAPVINAFTDGFSLGFA